MSKKSLSLKQQKSKSSSGRSKQIHVPVLANTSKPLPVSHVMLYQLFDAKTLYANRIPSMTTGIPPSHFATALDIFARNLFYLLQCRFSRIPYLRFISTKSSEKRFPLDIHPSEFIARPMILIDFQNTFSFWFSLFESQKYKALVQKHGSKNIFRFTTFRDRDQLFQKHYDAMITWVYENISPATDSLVYMINQSNGNTLELQIRRYPQQWTAITVFTPCNTFSIPASSLKPFALTIPSVKHASIFSISPKPSSVYRYHPSSPYKTSRPMSASASTFIPRPLPPNPYSSNSVFSESLTSAPPKAMLQATIILDRRNHCHLPDRLGKNEVDDYMLMFLLYLRKSYIESLPADSEPAPAFLLSFDKYNWANPEILLQRSLFRPVLRSSGN